MNAPIKPAAACATLAATLAVSLIFVSSGLAQEKAAPGTVEAERVTVTGEPVIVTKQRCSGGRWRRRSDRSCKSSQRILFAKPLGTNCRKIDSQVEIVRANVREPRNVQ